MCMPPVTEHQNTWSKNDRMEKRNPVIIKGFNTPLSVSNWQNRQNIRRDMEDLNIINNWFELTDI